MGAVGERNKLEEKSSSVGGGGWLRAGEKQRGKEEEG